MQAFRRLYEEVGLGWVYAITKYKPVSPLSLHKGICSPVDVPTSSMQNFRGFFYFFIYTLWLIRKARYSQIATIADAVYGVWAKYRLQITGNSYWI